MEGSNILELASALQNVGVRATIVVVNIADIVWAVILGATLLLACVFIIVAIFFYSQSTNKTSTDKKFKNIEEK